MYKSSYLCGPTLYSDIHLGNLRSMVLMDVLKKANPNMVYARNITDIDDKITLVADGQDPHEWVMRNTYQSFKKTMSEMSVADPDHEPFASQYISEMIADIKLMMVNYPEKFNHVSDGVTVSMQDFEWYGEISGRKVQDSLNPDNADAYVWKTNLPGFGYDSPWGYGRPSWHIECSTMINSIFGTEGIDLHAGGNDLLFPHHESENAQYKMMNKCCSGIAHKWLHVGFITMGGEKMAKSTGNNIAVKDALKDWSPEVLRCLMMIGKPSAPIDVTTGKLREIEKTIGRSKMNPMVDGSVYTASQVDKINRFDFRGAMMERI